MACLGIYANFTCVKSKGFEKKQVSKIMTFQANANLVRDTAKVIEISGHFAYHNIVLCSSLKVYIRLKHAGADSSQLVL